MPHAGFQDDPSFAAWLLSAILAAWMAWWDTAWLMSATAIVRRYREPISALRVSPQRISQIFGLILIAILIVIGLKMQVEIGRANLDVNSAVNRFAPDAEAAAWIRSHTDASAVVMARSVPTVCHYSKRKAVWFPPSSNPQLLMEGIQKRKVHFVLLVRQESKRKATTFPRRKNVLSRY